MSDTAPEIRPQISQQFAPHVDTSRVKEAADVFQRGVDSMSASAAAREVQGKRTELNLAQPQADQLFQLLLDKVEIQIDIHRRASELVSVEDIEEAEVDAEVERMMEWEQKKKVAEVQAKDGSVVRQAISKVANYWQDRKNEGVTEDDMRRVARERLRRNKIKKLKEFDHDPTDLEGGGDNGDESVLMDVDVAAVKSGEMSMVNVMNSFVDVGMLGQPGHGEPQEGVEAKPQDDVILRADKEMLASIESKIDKLMEDDAVLEVYRSMEEARVAKLKKVREVTYGRKIVRMAKLQRDVLVRKSKVDGRDLTRGETAIVERNSELVKAVEGRISEELKDEEVFDLVRLRELRDYQKGLKEHGFAETPSRLALIDAVREKWANGKKVLATGPTGTGKTELFEYASRSLFGVDTEVVNGHEQLSTYDIYGKPKGSAGFGEGPFARSLSHNVPLYIDEINTIPNEIIMRLKRDLNARLGTRIKIQEANGQVYTVGNRWAVGATANVKGEKHPDRVELDNAIVRMFEPLPVAYMPAHELYDVVLAKMMDVQGGVETVYTTRWYRCDGGILSGCWVDSECIQW